jgi:hypothetical protein
VFEGADPIRDSQGTSMTELFHAARVRIHRTLRVTPAMAAGLAERLWDVRDIVAPVEAAEAAEGPKKRGPYKPRQPKVA